MTKEYKIYETGDVKVCKSEHYNTMFNKNTGYFVRWGKNKEDDPQFAPFAEILDIEVSTICDGVSQKQGQAPSPCNFCYKGNTPNGENMSLSKFKKILDKFGNGLTQVAFGADSRATSNPELFDMMWYTRENGIIPNITVADISDETADELSKVCGAVAVSRYGNRQVCYDSVKRLTDRGMEQVNIHMMTSEETYEQACETIADRMIDGRLAKLNAIVFLSLKQKGRGTSHIPLSQEKFEGLMEMCLNNDISFGMDSCSAPKFLKFIEGTKYAHLETVVESCESSCFSAYIDVDGYYHPCSFSEGRFEKLDVLAYESFEDVWNHKNTLQFRDRLLSNGRECPLYEV